MSHRPLIRLEDGEIDLEGREVRRLGRVESLTPKEADLIAYLAARPGVVVAQDELMRKVWHGEKDSRAAYHVARRLRAKIEVDPTRPRHLVAVAGAGLRFDPAQSKPVLAPGDVALVAVVCLDPDGPWERDPVEAERSTEQVEKALLPMPDGAVALSVGEGTWVVGLQRAEEAVAYAQAITARMPERDVGIAVALGNPVPSALMGYRGAAVRRVVRLARGAIPQTVVFAAEIARQLPGPLFSVGVLRLAGLREPEPLFAVGMAPASATLPAPATSFVGRARERALVAAQYAAGVRVVTVSGPGGLGKTRLAIQLAREERGPVWWCDLSIARSPGDVVSIVAACVGAPGRIPIVDVLRARGEALLVLDDTDEVVEAVAPMVSAWLRAAPALRVLVTGREPLHIDGEHAIKLGPLDGEDAVMLFMSRARTLRADARLQPESVRAVVDRLDGWPLAIEICASRIDEQTVEGLLDDLVDRFQAVKSRRRDVVARHLSLEAALLSSTDRLKPALKTILGQCSVFCGGFDPEAAASVLCLPDASNVRTTLALLCERSLVVMAEEPSGVRYGLLDTIREFAADRFEDDGARSRHAAFYLAQGEAAKGRAAAGDATGVAWLIRERENLVAAYRTLQGSDLASAARVLLALEPAWASRGPAEITPELLDWAVETAERSGDDRLIAIARRARAYARLESGALDQAEEDLAVATATAERTSDESLLARVLSVASHLCYARDDVQEASNIAKRAQELALAAGDRRFASLICANRGVLAARLGAFSQAEQLLRASIAEHREDGLIREEAIAVGNLGSLLALLERDEEASGVLRSAIDLHQRSGNLWYASSVWLGLGDLALASGHLIEARRQIERALALALSTGGRMLEARARIALALLLLLEQDPERALFELRRAAEISHTPVTTALIETLRGFVGEEDVEARFQRSLATLASLHSDPWDVLAVELLQEAYLGRPIPPRRPPEHTLVRIVRRVIALRKVQGR